MARQYLLVVVALAGFQTVELPRFREHLATATLKFGYLSLANSLRFTLKAGD